MTWALLGVIMCMVMFQVFLMSQIQKLIDKFMSRNYAEYVQSTARQTVTKAQPNGEAPPDNDINVMTDFRM